MPVVKSKYAEDWNISFDDLKRKVFSVNVYYDKLEYTMITQVESMSTITLVSNVGGLLI